MARPKLRHLRFVSLEEIIVGELEVYRVRLVLFENQRAFAELRELRFIVQYVRMG